MEFKVGDDVTWEGAGLSEYETILGIDEEKQRFYFRGGYWLDIRHALPYPKVLQEPSVDYFDHLVLKARQRAEKAMAKFPQPNYVLNKVSEEHGEVVKAVIHYTEGRETWKNLEGELIDNLAMLIRLVTEGDEVIGFELPEHVKNFKGVK